jgi:hypothetical protein
MSRPEEPFAGDWLFGRGGALGLLELAGRFGDSAGGAGGGELGRLADGRGGGAAGVRTGFVAPALEVAFFRGAPQNGHRSASSSRTD